MHTMASTRFRWSITMVLVQYCCILVAAETYMNTDQSALLALKAHITSDPQNILTTNWSTSTTSNICSWVGVTCGVRHLRITALNLSCMSLTGTIPPHLGNLSFLVQLHFQNNSFHGSLPQELVRLRRLKHLNFAYNSLHRAEIPSWLGSFPKLQILSLCGNQFSGTIPTAIFNLSTLQVIDLQKNQLSGSIPREIGNLTMLKQINLDSNNFREIPNEVGTLHQMETFFVQSNALKGPVPVAIFNLSSLTTLTLYGNSLTGNIPDNICQHLPNIQRLNLGDNQFDGPLPSKLWQCKKLASLRLGSNSFTGRLPKNIGNLTLVKEIYLHYNNLKGTIPDEIGALKNLQSLQLGANNLNGSIPSTLFNMSSIERISLAVNQLSGSLPANIGLRVPKLQQLILTMNHLSGIIPNSISNASNLMLLAMPFNSFTGFIPVTLCDLTNLQNLLLNHNNLTIDTSTPEASSLSCLDNLRNLMLVDLGGNPLDATLPVSFGNLSTSLEYLNLNTGNLRGNIPNDIGNLSSLKNLGMKDNILHGSIPTSIGRLQSLQGLDLRNNKLQGHMPFELCQLVNLNFLLVDRNRLSGSIPSCLGNLTAGLRYLSLDSNFLNSTIPSTLWGLTNILYLGLSSNILTGSLPEDIGNLNFVTTLDLSSNHLSGIIPRRIGCLQALVQLSLSNNELQGPVPSSFGDLLSLELLELSSNNLSGEIPKTLQALSHLKYLNLSSNRLKGEIPTGGPFRNFSSESFVSNSALCGAARLHVPPCENSALIPNSRKASTSNLKYLIAGIISAVLLLVCALTFVLRRKRNVEVAIENSLLPQLLWKRVSRLELRRATNGFNESNLLGTGGFGSVYKATLVDGIDVAVKVFNMQLENAFKSFDIECAMLSNIRHRNLIKTISCCSDIDFKALVLQYMPNGSLEKWLYSQNCSLSFLQRLSIITDVALALEYLHHGYSIPIVHCDVKPSNILLDDDMVAHVSDFGIAKLMGGGDSMTQTITLATIGYMAPEYGMEGRVSTSGDVHSFGIVVMETFTKRKPTDEMFVGEMNLKQWVANSLLPDQIAQVLDADLLRTIQQKDHDFEAQRNCLSSVMRLALGCCAESPEERINMQEAVATLNKIKIKLLKDTAGGL